MKTFRYSGTCDVCGALHTRTLGNAWSSEPEEDFFSADCTNAACDPRHSAFLTRDPDEDEAA